MRILLVEDNISLCRAVCDRLTKEHYNVDFCHDGEEAREYIKTRAYDAVLLDIMLPGADGLTLLSEMRRDKDTTPVLLLTARSGIGDRVKGLDAGADDYLVKPFAADELLARVRVMIRRKSAGGISNVFTVGDLSVDCDRRTVKRGEKTINLSAKEFDLLECLARNEGSVVSRERIENCIYDLGYEGGSNVIDVYVRYLRKKIDDGFDTKLIHTVRGKGYMLRKGGEE